MKRRLFLIILLVSKVFFMDAQDEKRANIWYFHTEAGIDFNTSPPTPLSNGKIAKFPSEGSATLCDREGQLLIYTDGETIWNRSHEIISGADSIGGNTSVTQSSIILPSPADEQILYVFYLNVLDANDIQSNGEFYYAIIDMRMNGGLGGVVSIKNRLYDYCTEKLTAIRHCNQKDFWIIAHESGNENFLTWRLTAQGVSSEPKVQASGTKHFNPVGAMKSSPLGDKLAVANYNEHFVEIFEFDTEEGKFKFPITIRGGLLKNPYSLAFSPNGKRLYISNFRDSLLLQYNLDLPTAREITASQTLIAKMNTGLAKPGTLQNAPGGKIYVALNNSPYLSAIRQPNQLGMDCDFFEKEVWLDGKRSGISLPNFIPIYFRQKDTIEVIEFTQNCEGEKELRAIVSIGADSLAYEWYYQNELLPNSNSTKIQISSNGVYEFKALIFNNCKTVLKELTSIIEVEITEIEPLNIVKTIKKDATCAMPNGMLEVETSGGVGNYSFSIDRDSFQTNNRFSNLGGRNFEIIVRDERGCETSELIEIQQYYPPQLVAWENQPSLCGEETGKITMEIEGGFGAKKIVWNANEISSIWTIENLGKGDYSIQIIDESNCSIDTILSVASLNCPIYIPNAFSPNEDGKNDVFRLFPHPEFVGNIQFFRIFDRWGSLIFEDKEVDVKQIEWNGTFKGKKAVVGSYIYNLGIQYLNGETVISNGEIYLTY